MTTIGGSLDPLEAARERLCRNAGAAPSELSSTGETAPRFSGTYFSCAGIPHVSRRYLQAGTAVRETLAKEVGPLVHG